MTVRTPLKYDRANDRLIEMTTAEVDLMILQAVKKYGDDPSVTVTVVNSGGNISPGMQDTRLSAGAGLSSQTATPAQSSTQDAFPIDGTLYDRLTRNYQTASQPQFLINTSNRTLPVYWNSSAGRIQSMGSTDFLDTIIEPAIDLLVDGSKRPGVFFHHPTFGLGNYQRISGTPIFEDTRANVSAYTPGGIPEAVDQPTTEEDWYLFQTVNTLTGGVQNDYNFAQPIYADANGDLHEYDSATFNTNLSDSIRWAAVNHTNYTIDYNINGSGNNTGVAITDTRLNGTNYETRFVNANDYRAQEFPSGTAQTINTWNMKITKV